jgi:hypothetical protein
MTFILTEAEEKARKRADLSAGLRALAAWLDTHPGGPLPDVRATYPIPEGPRGMRVDALQEVADLLGVEVTEDDHGNLLAGRPFGPVPAGAALAHPDGTTTGYLARQATETGAGA